MNRTLTCAAAACLMGASAFAAGSTATEQKLIDLENATAKAFAQKDTAFFAANFADSWVVQDASGRHSKADMIADIKSGRMAVTSMTNHDMHVSVMGNVAFVQGMEDEKSSYGGHDSSGTYSWTDVAQMRGGKWQFVGTQVSKMMK